MGDRKPKRKSLVPVPSEDNAVESDSDSPHAHGAGPGQMDVDKEEMDFKKRVRATHKAYHAGLKQLKKDHERSSKVLFVKKEPGDYLEYLEEEDRKFLETAQSVLELHCKTGAMVKEQKDKLIAIEYFQKNLERKKLHIEQLKQKHESQKNASQWKPSAFTLPKFF